MPPPSDARDADAAPAGRDADNDLAGPRAADARPLRLRDMPAAPARPLVTEPPTVVEPRGPDDGDPPIPARHDRIGHYVVLDRLGAGAMGVVLSAYDARLDRKVALKLLRPDTHPNEKGIHRMRREAQVMARLSHPNVAQVYEADEVDGQLFLAMEFVDGLTLRDWTAQRPRPWREVLAVCRQAGLGLAAAHAAGVVHRDFKPDNIMVGADGRVRVLDFGLSRGHAGASRPRLDITRQNLADIGVTAAGSMLGTPAYMAPEQFRGDEADARSDQFGFCVAVWESLHGRRPFAGDNVDELRRHVLAGRLLAPPPGAATPAWLRRALERGLALDPAARWPDMHALLAALARDPQRTRRRAAAGALAVLAVAAAGYALAALRDADARSCDAADELADVWDAPQREALESAIRTTGVAYADATISAAAHHLGAYRDAWLAAHTTTCLAHRRGSLSDALFDRRMACLRQRRGELVATVSVLAQTDHATVPRAAATAASLPPLSDCADDEHLLADLPRPADPAAALALDRAQARLALAQALVRMHRIPDAREISDELERTIQTLDHLPLRAEVTLLAGTIAASTLRVPEALKYFEAAEALALEARADEVAAQALAYWIFTVSESAGRPADALAAGPRALALLRRVGSPPGLAAFLHQAIAVARSAGGDHDGCTAELAAALAALLRDAPDDPFRADLVHNLGFEWTTYGRHDLARDLVEPEIRRMTASHGACHPDTAELRLVHALAERGAGNLDAAVALAETSLACLTADAPARALRALNILFGLHDLRADVPAQRQQVERAEPLLARADAPVFRIIFALNRAEVALAEARTAEARTLLTSASDALADDATQHDLIILCELDLSRLALAEHDTAAALAHANRAANLLTPRFSSSFHARVRFTQARALRAVDDKARAATLADEAIHAYESAGPGWSSKAAEIRTWLASL